MHGLPGQAGPILYQDRAGESDAGKARKKKAASKTKYTCPGCEFNAWAKPDGNLWCGDCKEQMEAEEPGGRTEGQAQAGLPKLTFAVMPSQAVPHRHLRTITFFKYPSG